LVLHESAVQLLILAQRNKYRSRNNFNEVARAPTCPRAPDKLVSIADKEVMNKIQVERVSALAELRTYAIGSVVVALHLNVRSVAQIASPARYQVAARRIFGALQIRLTGRRKHANANLLPDAALIKVALHGQPIAAAQPGIGTETCLPQLPPVIVIAIRMEFRAPAKTHCIGAIIHRPVSSPVTHSS